MATSIAEKILSSNKFYTDKYLKDTINLTKSIVIVNSKEASLYNNLIEYEYPSHSIDYSDKTTWRYYKHLAGQYHILDTPIVFTSIDNGESITLSHSTLSLHRITHTELLKFDLFYKELIDKYPEQELFIRSVIATSSKKSISNIILSPDFTIVGYNDRLIEDNEDDIIYNLQERINNYKVSRLLQYYSLSDNLYIASLYQVLYNFIVKSLIAIRLKNAKTLRAHSYHILNYLASHHYLDIYYSGLNRKQSLYLYRNLLYLDNHSGRNDIFRELIDKLFTERNITIVNYSYSQSNTVDSKNYMEYKFKQELLNNSNLVYSYRDYTLDNLLEKEYSLAPSNEKHIKYNRESIDVSYKNALYSSLLTKDIEAITVDNTDTVKHKLIPTIVDYWAYLLKTKRMKYLVSVLDPVSNKEFRLETNDLFKLYTIILYKLNNIEISEFPNYQINRVYKSTLPNKEQLLNYFYRKHYYYSDYIDNILVSIPSYRSTITSYQFEQFVSSIYKLNIGLWLFTSNLHDKDDEGQFENLISNLHTYEVYTFNNETVQSFLNRLGLEDIFNYPIEALEDLSYSILNNVYDNKLSFINKYKYIQKSLIEIFKKFNSYTVQIINNYSQTAPVLAAPSEPRVTLDFDSNSKEYFYDSYLVNVEVDYRINYNKSILFTSTITANEIHKASYDVPIDSVLEINYKHDIYVPILFTNNIVNDLDNSNWIVSESSEEDKIFLALNQ